jgi:hypothetical protein
MGKIVVSLEVIEIPWVIRSLELTLGTLQDEARRTGRDPDFFGVIPVYKQLIKTFREIGTD